MRDGYYVVWCKDCDAYIDHGWHQGILRNSANVHKRNYPDHEVEIKYNETLTAIGYAEERDAYFRGE